MTSAWIAASTSSRTSRSKPGEDITNEELELMIAMLHELKKPSLVEQFLAEKLSNIRYVWK